MDAREDLPRISVDSVHGWQKVRSNYTDATFAALQAQIASRGHSRERDAIRAHLEQFIDRTFTLAQPNLRVNGHNFESFDENGRETEPFDEILDRRIWSLADTRLQWHKRIAETRRTIPSEIESAISTLMQEHRDLDTIILPPTTEEQLEQSPEDDDTHQRVQAALQKTSALANELEQTVTQQHERGERVKLIASEVNSLKP
ncbi:hypothetical protein NLJ89_g11064 [Agrocybe chaxingu]|uniref:Uncharacterized protein n=1 Tax=Agrocybe chaxingu TaxID=84603 RepID=A0A9W8MRZ7_9AGAR|nr:hypothetical protein NLJ89_g11064 [Agrocybe chaxingu]